MAITTRDGLIDALANNSSRIVIDKASLANARSRARGGGLHRSAGHHRGDNACCDGSSGCVLRRTASFCWV